MSAEKTFLDSAEQILKVLALLGAVLYFLYKLTNGTYIFNLSVSLNFDRRSDPNGGDDCLYLTIRLKKGDVSTIELHDIQARVSYFMDGQMTERKSTFKGLKRTQPKRSDASLEVLWDAETPLRMGPGEETQFSTLIRVPAATICFVELAVVGKRAYVGFIPAAWKATAFVPPVEPKASGEGTPLSGA